MTPCLRSPVRASSPSTAPSPSPTQGAAAGLAVLEAAGGPAGSETFQAHWAAKADMQARLGLPEADMSYERAIGLETDPAVQAFLIERRAAAGLSEINDRPSTSL